MDNTHNNTSILRSDLAQLLTWAHVADLSATYTCSSMSLTAQVELHTRAAISTRRILNSIFNYP